MSSGSAASGAGGSGLDDHRRARERLRLGGGDATVDRDAPRGDEALDRGAREAERAGAEDAVEPLPGLVGGERDLDRSAAVGLGRGHQIGD